MIDTDPTGPNEEEVTVDVKREYKDDEVVEGSFYVEKETDLIYEVRFFPNFALVRPAHPEFTSLLERLDLLVFASKFNEFLGDPRTVQNFMWGAETDLIEITRKK